MGNKTVIVVTEDSRPVAASMVTEHVVVVENHSGLRHLVRGHTVEKVVLVGLTRASIAGELASALKDACLTHELNSGAPVPYLEV